MEPVGALAVDILAVDRNFELDQPADAALAHDHVVKCCGLKHRRAIAAYLRIQQDAFLSDILAAQDFGDRVEHAVDGDIGQKPEMALVDTD